MKLAPVARELARRPDVGHVILHTGQHYDREMSDDFFTDLGIPEPHENLEVGSGSHARQTAAILERFEAFVASDRPDVVLVYGDVNSTLAAALVCAKAGIPVAHVEAGLRSADWSMPEEINRIVTDRLSSLLLLPSRDAADNLRAEGVPSERLEFVGNVMIDSLVRALPAARERDAAAGLGVEPRGYVVVTLHRPSNVDRPDRLRAILRVLAELSRRHPVLFPAHPRTRDRIETLGWSVPPGCDLRLLDPAPYLSMLSLLASSRLVITDSGGIQEETSFLGIPCATLRPNTERPITCTAGTNTLLPPDDPGLLEACIELLDGGPTGDAACAIERWDGRTAGRIVDVLCDGGHYPV